MIKTFSIIVTMLLMASTAMADSKTLDGQSDMDDAYCDGNFPDLERGTESWLYVMCGFSSCTYTGLLKFDLSGISGTIDSVSLKLRRHTPNKSPQIYLHRITTDWVEDEVTYNSAQDGVSWTTGGGDYISTKTDSLTDVGTADYNQDVYCQRGEGVGLAQLIQDWIDGTYPNYGILLRSSLLGIGDTVYFYSTENFNEELWPRPKLYIEYTPDEEPEGEIMSRRRKIITTRGNL